jgi:hypothetical protein
MRTESGVGENSFAARCKYERSEIVLEELAGKVFRKPIVERLPDFERVLREQDPRIERNAAVGEPGYVDVSDLERVICGVWQ